jgi:hypothetical protein
MLEPSGVVASSRLFYVFDVIAQLGASFPLPDGPLHALSPLAEVPAAALASLSFAALLVLVLRAAMRANQRARSVHGRGIEPPRPRSVRVYGLPGGAAHAGDDFRPAA